VKIFGWYCVFVFFDFVDVTSPEYDEFLTYLGDKIKIEGWKGFTGGLTPYSTEYSIYTNYKEREIMYHVATLFPNDENDEQSIEKKKIFW